MNATRPKLLTALAVIQWLLSIAYLVPAWFFSSFLIWRVAEGRGANWPLSVATTTCISFVLCAGIAGRGLWQQRMSGQVMAITHMALQLALCGYEWMSWGRWESALFAIFAFVVPILALHLLPSTWRAFRAATLETPAPSI